MGILGKLFGKGGGVGKSSLMEEAGKEGLWSLWCSSSGEGSGSRMTYDEVGRYSSEDEARADMDSLSDTVEPGTMFILKSPEEGVASFWRAEGDGKLSRS